jgi:rsbT co-antagonist protein RsbR
MPITAEMERTLEKFDLSREDIARVRDVGRMLHDAFVLVVDEFYAWLSRHQEYRTFFGGNQRTLERVKASQIDHWRTFFAAELDDAYFASRRHIGAVHAHIELPNDIYYAGMRVSLAAILRQLRALEPRPANLEELEASVTKLVFFDTYLVADEISRIQKDKILISSKALMEMSTPVTPIWEGILLLPLVGILDSARTQEIMNKTLAKIAETRARMFVLDISGVGAVDTAVANQLIKITRATQLMGCESIISGISPPIARTLVELGVQVGDVKTTATLRDALELALKAIGVDRQLQSSAASTRGTAR